MPLPLAVAAGVGLSSLAGVAGSVGTIASIALAAWRIYAILGLAVSAFWAAVAYFAHDLFEWVMDLCLWLVANALEFAGVEQPGESLMLMISQLPPVVLDAWAMLGVFNDMKIMFAAFAMNFALRSIPLIGGMFRG